ncbi:MAG: acyltransferase [Saprospiraceae bacterium]|nr:acyltransferase [Lewinellaceae bacterium]
MGDPTSHTENDAPVPLAEAPQRQYKRVYANYIRAFAACAVVQMHSVGGYLYTFDPTADPDVRFLTADIIYGHLRWATPFFILISGALLLNPSKQESISVFLKKRLRRVLIPFAFWGTIYLLYLYRGNMYYGTWPELKDVLNTIFYNDIYFHLWFIPMITGLYLLTPIFRIFIQNAKRSDIEYFLVLSFTITALQHFLPGIIFVKYIGWMGYIGFYVLGYYLSAFPIKRSWKKVIYPLALAMPLTGAFLTWWLTVQAGEYDARVFVYSSPNVVIMIFALFLFLKDFDWGTFATRYPRVHRAFNRLADLSYGVYFIHVLILDVIKNGYIFGIKVIPHYFFNIEIHPAIGAPLVGIVGILLSVLLISLLSRVVFMKKWLM